MRTFGIGLAVALILSAVAPQGAWAAPKADVTKEQRAKGMAAAPGLVAAGKLDCQVSDARFIGEGSDPKTKFSTDFALKEGNNAVLVVARESADFSSRRSLVIRRRPPAVAQKLNAAVEPQ